MHPGRRIEKSYGKPRTFHKTGYCKRIRQGRQRRGIDTNHVKNPVLIECGVYQNCGFEDIRPDITSRVSLDALPRQRKQPFGWVFEMFIEIPRIVAFLVLLVEVVQKCLANTAQLKKSARALGDVKPT